MTRAPRGRVTVVRALRGLAVVHPIPTALNATLVAALTVVAVGDAIVALALAGAMVGFQAAIGALNDVVDADRDRIAKPRKPLPAGLISPRSASGLVVAGAVAGLLISAAFGWPVLILGAAGLGAGVAYDVFMRRSGLGWLCFAVAFPLLLSWTWLAAAGELPPGWPALLPLAALAGPTLHLANSLVDADTDRQVGVRSLATALGPRAGPRVLAALEVGIYVLALAALVALAEVTVLALALVLAAMLMAVLGVVLSAGRSAARREVGWLLQAGALAILAVAWVAALAGAGAAPA